MPTPLSLSKARELCTQAAASLVVLEMPDHQGLGFVVHGQGLLLTNLHVVAGAEQVQALLPDGRLLSVKELVAVDERHDIAVLHLPTGDVPPLCLASDELPAAGEILLALAPTESGAAPVPARVRSHQALDDNLSVLELEEDLPEGSSGSPVLDRSGRVVGVATQALVDERPVTLVVPARYLHRLLQTSNRLPLSTLATWARRTVRARQVPQHSLALLEGCPPDSVESIASTLVEAIQVGAPSYNRGDVTGCYRLYQRTAEQLIDERSDCPGAQAALLAGLQRCLTLEDDDARAWALRDTFDGLLDVMDKWLQAQAAFARMSAPRSWLQ